MSVTVLRYEQAQAKQWDAFVWSSRNGTFFHTRNFLSYHPEGRFADHSLLFFEGSDLVAVLAAAQQENILVSHPGASYGGLVLSPDYGVMTTHGVFTALKEYAVKAGLSGVRFLRLTPSSVRRFASDDQEYWMYQTGWKQIRCELASSIFLHGLSEENLLQSFTGKCRNAVRQGERSGLATKETKDFSSFWPILKETLRAKHAAKPTHSLEEITRLHSLAPDAIRLFGAYHGKEMVAGILAIALHDLAVYTLYIAQNYQYQQSRPVHLIMAELLRVCLREGRRLLHLGVSTEDGGKQVNEGLFFFKESFGAKPIRRESFELLF